MKRVVDVVRRLVGSEAENGGKIDFEKAARHGMQWMEGWMDGNAKWPRLGSTQFRIVVGRIIAASRERPPLLFFCFSVSDFFGNPASSGEGEILYSLRATS
ncbi:unnamed protein product [Caenorhabditis auriculariae]|uniref:Uncharacterized protein n=1 Tax=Caenorhabditis auriculariae TaxID=2777116 RepID=A0A8S1HIR2_9PELO|nr:unnamed protein product [Caenorhabditis auriculariae]